MAEGAADVCICVLFYGAEDRHFKLAQRVLNEHMRCLAKQNVEFRFGCNAVGADTTTFLHEQIAAHFPSARLFYSVENIMKYPIMRQMFHNPPITAPITVWFDHDSYLDLASSAEDWLNDIPRYLSCCDMLGSIQRGKLSDAQRTWIAEQPWFNSTCNKTLTYMTYAVGGWWAIKTDLLTRFNWPANDLKQKNGDIILGALLKHQELSLCHFRGGVRINVNDSDVEAAAPRTMTA